MLKHLIGSLRKKPVHVRQNVAFWGAVGFTAVVVSVWAYHLPARHQSLAVQQGADEAAEEPSGLSGIIDIIGDGFGGMQAALSSVEEESAPSSTTIRAEQSLQAAIDEARSTTSARQSMVSSDTDVVGSAVGTSTPEVGVAATSSVATSTATTTGAVELPEPRPVRIVTTSATPTATSTTE